MPLHEPTSERTARRLASELEELTRTLQRAGATGIEASRLLELASLATMHAVGLEHALDRTPPPAAPADPPAEPREWRPARAA